jgi:hypothetical protein
MPIRALSTARSDAGAACRHGDSERNHSNRRSVSNSGRLARQHAHIVRRARVPVGMKPKHADDREPDSIVVQEAASPPCARMVIQRPGRWAEFDFQSAWARPRSHARTRRGREDGTVSACIRADRGARDPAPADGMNGKQFFSAVVETSYPDRRSRQCGAPRLAIEQLGRKVQIMRAPRYGLGAGYTL